MPELRKDPITRGWVIFAPERSKRPSDFFRHKKSDDKENCPFCPGRESDNDTGLVLRVESSNNYEDYPWSLKIIPDKYPLLSESDGFERFGEGMYDLMRGFGRHELLLESPIHEERFDDFVPEHLESIFTVYQQRIIELSRNKRIQQVLITRNIGREAGAHIHHPHSHIVALPIVPKKLEEEVAGARFYYQFKERCIFCDIISQEIEDRERVVMENEDFVAFCPYASRFPFEVTILPRLHLARYETIRRNEVAQLARMMKRLIGGLNSLLKDPPLNYIVHSAPTVHARGERFEDLGRYYHWHIEILPKLTRVAGFEWGTGFYINPILPEDAARHLKEAVEGKGAKA